MHNTLLVIILLVGSLVVVFGALILFLVYMAKRMGKQSGTATTPPAPKATSPSSTPPSKLLEIVKERYAKGEITREQYEQLKKDLG